MDITEKPQLLSFNQQTRYYLEQSAHWIAIAIAFVIPISTGLTSILFPLAVILSICIGRWRERFLPLLHNPLALLFCIFFGLFLIGSLYSSATNAEAIRMLTRYSKFLLAIFIIPLFMDKRCRTYAIYAFLAAMLITLVLSYLKIMGLLHFNMKNPGAAVFKSHIQTNFLMSMAAYLIAHQSIKESKYRFLWIIFLIFFVINILFLSTGRSGYVVFFALLVLFLWQQIKWRGCVYALLAIIVLSLLAYFISPQFYSRINETQQNIYQYVDLGNGNTSVGLRINFVRVSLEIIKAHPILGTGTGSFATEYSKRETNPLLQTGNPHNEYLNVATQLGLIGLALLIFMFYKIWCSSFRLSPSMQVLLQGITVAVIIGSFANSWLMDTTEGHLFVYFLAIAFGQFINQKKRNFDSNEFL